MKHPGFIAALAVALSGAPLALVHAAMADGTKARSDAQGCDGKNAHAVDRKLRSLNGQVFLNRSDDTVVRIDRYRIYDAKGNLILDSGAGGNPPAFFNGAPADAAGRSLGARHGDRRPTGIIAGLYTTTVTESSPSPITVKVDWYADGKAPSAEGRWARRGDDSAGTFRFGFRYDCRYLEVEPGGH